jgi:uncharacterized protein YbbK (DUF523 family)
LAGINCNFAGKAKTCEKIVELVRQGKAIPACPEQLGGLPTPRIPSEQKGSLIINAEGKNVTVEFRNGAEETLRIARLFGCKKAILKSKSPSCGFGMIYDGSFTRTLKKGNGVTAELLSKNGIEIITEKEL